MRDLGRRFQRERLTDEAFDDRAVRKLHAADAERRGDSGDEAAEVGSRNRPDLHLDAGAIEAGGAHQAGLGRGRVGQGIEPVAACGLRSRRKICPTLGKLAVQRLSSEVRADDGQQGASGQRGERRQGRGLGHRRCQAAECPARVPVQPVSDGQQREVGLGGTDERDAERQAIRTKPSGQGDGGQVKQVDEIGVVAKVRIQTYWLGLNFGQRVRRRGRGQQQEVRFLPDYGCLPP